MDYRLKVVQQNTERLFNVGVDIAMSLNPQHSKSYFLLTSLYSVKETTRTLLRKIEVTVIKTPLQRW